VLAGAPLLFVWQGDSSAFSLTNDDIFSGAGSKRTLRLLLLGSTQPTY